MLLGWLNGGGGEGRTFSSVTVVDDKCIKNSWLKIWMEKLI